MLSEALKPLLAYHQFINWSDESGTKIPCGPGGNNIDPHDPGNWMSYENAVATGRPVGFVLTAADPFFCLDVDKCLTPENTWDERAQTAFALLPGAAVEVSISGRGLHLWGMTADLGDRRKKFNGYELYTAERFIALGNQQTATGFAGYDWTQALAAWVPVKETLPAAMMSDGPDPMWTGPSSDDELIRRMMNSSPSAKTVWGNGCTLQDLWHGNDDALARAYPDPTGNAPFDHSSADMALAMHLAFWTGKDAARMDRLFRQSALMRDKWEDRGDYRQMTFSEAVRLTVGVYQGAGDVEPPSTVPAVMEEASVPVGQPKNTPDWLNEHQQLDFFAGCVYVESEHKVLVPSGSMLKPAQFRVMYGGYQFAMSADSEKPTFSAFEAFTEHRSISFPKAHRPAFRPEKPPLQVFEEEGVILANTYVPVKVPRVQGDPSPFLNHLEKMLPVATDRAIVLAYMAAVVQHPGVKFQWCPVVQGAEGNGKTLIARCIEHAVGRKYTHYPNAGDLGNKFNAWVQGNLFIGIEELQTKDKHDLVEALKPLVTNNRVEVQGKGADQVTGDNRANFFATTNHKDAIAKTRNDRRYAPFFCAQQDVDDINRDGMGGAYFPNLYTWFDTGGSAIMAEYLYTYDIPDELNPAKLCHRAPHTSATEEAISKSLGRVEQGIMEAVDMELTGFRGDWISSVALDSYLRDTLNIRSISYSRRSDILKSLGYVKHPALTNGRATSVVLHEKGRPTLFVRQNSPASFITDPGEATTSYIQSQNYVMNAPT